jgi:hypothetical protein
MLMASALPSSGFKRPAAEAPAALASTMQAHRHNTTMFFMGFFTMIKSPFFTGCAVDCFWFLF